MSNGMDTNYELKTYRSCNIYEYSSEYSFYDISNDSSMRIIFVRLVFSVSYIG